MPHEAADQSCGENSRSQSQRAQLPHRPRRIASAPPTARTTRAGRPRRRRRLPRPPRRPADRVLPRPLCRTIVTENDSPDVGFRFSLNLNRGRRLAELVRVRPWHHKHHRRFPGPRRPDVSIPRPAGRIISRVPAMGYASRLCPNQTESEREMNESNQEPSSNDDAGAGGSPERRPPSPATSWHDSDEAFGRGRRTGWAFPASTSKRTTAASSRPWNTSWTAGRRSRTRRSKTFGCLHHPRTPDTAPS